MFRPTGPLNTLPAFQASRGTKSFLPEHQESTQHCRHPSEQEDGTGAAHTDVSKAARGAAFLAVQRAMQRAMHSELSLAWGKALAHTGAAPTEGSGGNRPVLEVKGTVEERGC